MAIAKSKLNADFLAARERFEIAKIELQLSFSGLKAIIPVTDRGAVARGQMDEIAKQIKSLHDVLHGRDRSDTHKVRDDRADSKHAIFTPVTK